MKIALYKSSEYDHTMVFTAPGCTGYTRVSEFVEVEFPPRAPGEAEQEQVNAIDAQIKTVMAESEAKLTALKAKRAELLALPLLEDE